MAAGKYVRFGLRADKNLADLPNQNTALGNVLDDLVVGTAFTPQDLKVIDDLQLTDVYADDLSELAGKEITYRDFIFNDDGSVDISNPIPVNPTVTIKDRIVNRKVVLGDPPYQLGGTGPNAKIIPSSALQAGAYSTPPSSTPDFDDIIDDTNSDIVTGKDFWIDGRFAFANSFDETFTDVFGALSWEGYLAYPSDRELRVATNGFFLIELDKNNNDSWETIKGVWYTDYTATCAVTTATDDLQITLNAADMDRVFPGMKVVIDNADPTPDDIFLITSANTQTNIITILPDETTAAAGVTFTAGDSISISWEFGRDEIDVREFTLPPMFTGDAKHYRFTSWWPTTTQMGINQIQYRSKYVTWDANDSGRDDFMPYNYWYKQPQTIPSTDQFTYQYFKENKIGPAKSGLDKIVENQKPVFIRYEPKVYLDQKFRYTTSGSPTTKQMIWNGDLSFTVADTVNDNVNPIKVGDYFIPFNGTANAQVYFFKVYEKTNTTIFVDPNVTTQTEMNNAMNGLTNFVAPGGTVDLCVFDSIGLTFIGRSNATGTASAGAPLFYSVIPTQNAVNPFDARDVGDDNLIIATGQAGTSSFTRFRRITEVTLANATDLDFFTHPIDTGDGGSHSTNEPIIVYSHRGLNDNSIKSQCAGVYGKEVASFPQVSAGATTIHLYDVEGVTAGDLIQYPGRIVGYDPNASTSNTSNDGSQFSRVLAVNTTPTDRGDGILCPSITLQHGESSAPFGSGDGKTNPVGDTVYNDIPNAFTLIFIKEGSNPSAPTWALNGGQHILDTDPDVVDDKNYCILPLNTAPPFLGNNLGLSTSLTNPHLNINGDLEVTGLQFDQMTTREVTDVPGYSQATDAESAGGLYIKQYQTNKDFWILFK